MAILGVDDFKSKISGGGARANMFKATINFPAYAGGDAEFTSFMVKSAGLPASNLGIIEIPFRGRILKIAGDRTFEPWTITILNDAQFKVRDSFETWMNGINEHVNNTGLVNPIDYQADMIVEQLNADGSTAKTYTLRAAFPTNVSQIDVSYDSNDTIEEFTVELQYQYWESNTTT
tara:strand:+ start:175 stop:702 length:528 start_codon:yes stop_codon:yes gene_type:complete